jgi:hypothetical protein
MCATSRRIPFFVGCMIVPFIFFLRRNLEETEEFAARKHRPSMGDVFRTLAQNWVIVFAGMMMVVTCRVSQMLGRCGTMPVSA